MKQELWTMHFDEIKVNISIDVEVFLRLPYDQINKYFSYLT